MSKTKFVFPDTKASKPEFPNNEQSTFREKSESHQALDIIWSSYFSDESRQKFRSLLYQFIAAFFLEQEKEFTIEGIINPFSGGHHISSLPKKYHQPLRDLLNHLIYDIHKGNTSNLALSLSRFYDGINNIKKRGKESVNINEIGITQKEEIIKYINSNKLIISARDYLNIKQKKISEDIKSEEKKKEETSAIKTNQINKKENEKKKIITSKVLEPVTKDLLQLAQEENQEISGQKYQQEAKDINKLQKQSGDTNKNKELSAQEYFIEALVAEIDGDTDKAFKFHKQAFNKGYSEENKAASNEKDKSEVVNNIADETILGIWHYFLKKNKTKQGINYLKKVIVKRNIPIALCIIGGIYSEGLFGIKADNVEGFNYIKRAADIGYPSAQVLLATYYHIGKIVEKDQKEELRLLKLAAEQGYWLAQHNLASCYMNGVGVEKDLKETFRLLKLAVRQGYWFTQFHLGLCYNDGYGVETNLKEAFRLYKLAAAQCEILPQSQSRLYLSDQDPKESVKSFKSLLDQAKSEVFYRLGLFYMSDEITDQNPEEAVRLFKLAADQGEKRAQYKLGECFLQSQGVDQNPEEAVRLFKLAAEQGEKRAQYKLGMCYTEGIGTDQNLKEAFKLFKILAKQRDKDCQFYLGIFYLTGKGVSQSLTKAVKWLKLAAENNCALAQYNLGLCYMNGVGVEKDPVKAVELYKAAAENGDKDAQYNLGLCYMNGLGISRDPKKAFRCYMEAAKNGSQDALNAVNSQVLDLVELFKAAAENGDKDDLKSQTPDLIKQNYSILSSTISSSTISSSTSSTVSTKPHSAISSSSSATAEEQEKKFNSRLEYLRKLSEKPPSEDKHKKIEFDHLKSTIRACVEHLNNNPGSNSKAKRAELVSIVKKLNPAPENPVPSLSVTTSGSQIVKLKEDTSGKIK